MKTSDYGVNIIKQFEGVRLSCYFDSVGVPTIGFGKTGPSVYPGLVITMAQAEVFLRQDLEKFESFINAVVTQPISQKMFDALVSFTYNVGEGNLQKSSVLRLLNIDDYVSAGEAFLLWNKAGGIVVPGLTRRRAIESALFVQGITDLDNPPADAPDSSTTNPPAACEPVDNSDVVPARTFHTPSNSGWVVPAPIVEAGNSDDPTSSAPFSIV